MIPVSNSNLRLAKGESRREEKKCEIRSTGAPPAFFPSRLFYLNPAESRNTLNRKARPATTSGLRLWIGHLKAFTAQRFDKIDRRPAYQIKTDRIDHKPRTVALGNHIVSIDALGQAEAILKARTAAAINRQPQDWIFAKLYSDFRDAAGSVGKQSDFGNCDHVTQYRDKEKGGKALPP